MYWIAILFVAFLTSPLAGFTQNALTLVTAAQAAMTVAEGGTGIPPHVLRVEGGTGIPPHVLRAEGGTGIPPHVLRAEGGTGIPPHVLRAEGGTGIPPHVS
jgi:hypothetical protein